SSVAAGRPSIDSRHAGGGFIDRLVTIGQRKPAAEPRLGSRLHFSQPADNADRADIGGMDDPRRPGGFAMVAGGSKYGGLLVRVGVVPSGFGHDSSLVHGRETSRDPQAASEGGQRRKPA